jgi:hypothetical protein
MDKCPSALIAVKALDAIPAEFAVGAQLNHVVTAS